MPHASPHSLAANDVTVETYYNGHQSILIGHCSKTHFEMTNPRRAMVIKTSRLVSWFKNRVETNGRTDRTDCITFLANAVGKELEKHSLDVPLATLATCSSCDLEL